MPSVPNGPMLDTRDVFQGAWMLAWSVQTSRVLLRTPGGTFGCPELAGGVVLLYHDQTWDPDEQFWRATWRGSLGDSVLQVHVVSQPSVNEFVYYHGELENAPESLFAQWDSGERYGWDLLYAVGLPDYAGLTTEGQLTFVSEWVDVAEMFPSATLADII